MQTPLHPFGTTELHVPALCIGLAAIGDMPETFAYGVAEAEALAFLREVFAGAIPFVDTAASYGDGESERRIGVILREIGGLPPTFVLATKADRNLHNGQRKNNVVWYETLPENNILTDLHVTPGDHIHAEMLLASGSSEQWTLTITDVTSHRAFTIPLRYPSNQVYADFIVEDPYTSISANATQYPLPNFSPVTFTGANVRYGNQWIPLAHLPSLLITLQEQGETLATPSVIMQSDSFTVTRSLATHQ